MTTLPVALCAISPPRNTMKQRWNGMYPAAHGCGNVDPANVVMIDSGFDWLITMEKVT
jgi:hypothetical protein